jgi:two-component system sensor histidine kinase/response regulator
MKKVALVEDNADNRLVVRVILGKRFQVTCYEDGPQALEGFAHDRPDLILLDISLPKMDGVEVLRHVRADPQLSTLPVFALTAYEMPEDREKLLAAGFDDYITKPILDVEEFISRIQHALEGVTS